MASRDTWRTVDRHFTRDIPTEIPENIARYPLPWSTAIHTRHTIKRIISRGATMGGRAVIKLYSRRGFRRDHLTRAGREQAPFNRNFTPSGVHYLYRYIARARGIALID